jgi:molecular chaperone GrpE
MAKNKDDTIMEEPTGAERNGQPAADAEKAAATPEEDSQLLELRKRVEEMETAIAEQKDQYLRLLAEYDNYRKRSQKEKEQIYPDAIGSAVLAILPVYDNLERALSQPCNDKAFLKGIELTMSQFKEALTRLGVSEIPALGESFDPTKHDAMLHVEDENYGENAVVEVLRAGFQMGDRVLRCSMVKVAN